MGAMRKYAGAVVVGGLTVLALAPGRSEYTVSEVTEHLRTNAATIRAFLDRSITIEEPDGDRPGRVVVD